MDDGVSMGDGVNLRGEDSGRVSDRVDIGVCERNVFVEEKDGGVGVLC